MDSQQWSQLLSQQWPSSTLARGRPYDLLCACLAGCFAEVVGVVWCVGCVVGWLVGWLASVGRSSGWLTGGFLDLSVWWLLCRSVGLLAGLLVVSLSVWPVGMSLVRCLVHGLAGYVFWHGQPAVEQAVAQQLLPWPRSALAVADLARA